MSWHANTDISKRDAGVSEFTMFQDAYITLHDQLAVLSRFDHATMNSESQKLLHEHPSDSDSDPEPERRPSPGHLSPSPSSSRATSTSPAPPGSRPNGFSQKRQSSFARPRADGVPRTPNRVRFDDAPIGTSNGDRDWIELEGDDYVGSDGHGGRERVQRLPLLTGIEAPSVTVAEDFDPEDYLESARPRSGMKSAFMNMANSIMWDAFTRCQELPSANMKQRRRHHRSTLCYPQRRPGHRHRPSHWPYNHRGLDHPIDRYKFEAQRHRLLSGHGATLLWQVRFDSHLAGTMALVCEDPRIGYLNML